ncbi:DsrH/TusB family sulfur relay protein [bacterium]|nr:DsrH/TusB family sulfur relay protein [bacterium]
MKKICFMLTKSPYGHTETSELLNRARPGDVVVIAQDAVFALTDPAGDFSRQVTQKKESGVNIVASAPDCLARGIQPFPTIPWVSFAEQVDLICECELFC